MAPNKMLLIFELNGTLGHFTRSKQAISALNPNVQRLYKDASPMHQDKNCSIYGRPNLKQITSNFLIKNKKQYDIGIWSSANFDDTKLMVDTFFGRFYTQLLFVQFKKGGQKKPSGGFFSRQQPASDIEDPRAHELDRNLSTVWNKFTQHSAESTIMISPFYNTQDEFCRNDLVIPEYHPLAGTTDFLDDKYLTYVFNYLRMLNAIEQTIGNDVRQRMEMLPFEQYLQRTLRQMNVDQYMHTDDRF